VAGSGAGNAIAVLVHGTFAAEATWVSTDGAWARALRERAAIDEIVTYRWSGQNSHAARIKAGADLAVVIRELLPRARAIHLVGHSHGGNVILYAMRHLASDSVASTTFLATPFLGMARSDPSKIAQQFIGILSPLAMYAAFFAAMIASLVLGFALLPVDEHPGVTFVAMLALALGSGGWAFQAAERLMAKALPRLKSYLSDLSAARADLLRQVAPSCPVLVSTVQQDEALAWLTASDAVAGGPWLLWRALRQVLEGLIIAIGLFFFAALAVDLFAGGGWQDPAIKALVDGIAVIAGVGVIAVVVAAVSAPVSKGVRGQGLAFGGENAFDRMLLGLTPSGRPSWPLPTGSRVLSYRRKRQGNWRHNAFYEDRQIIADAADWVAAVNVGAGGRDQGVPRGRLASSRRGARLATLAGWGFFIWLWCRAVMLHSG